MNKDISTLGKFYDNLPGKIELIREKLGHPLTLSEKILYSHIFEGSSFKEFKKGTDYTEFSPDRLAMQDATAQMALLQFMMTGRRSTAIPSTVHCDHLIIAENGAEADLNSALEINREVYDFLGSVCKKYGIGFWKPGTGIIHQIILENYAFPGGMIIGTDSHTPNAGGLGMIAIGTGGADAADAMAGLAWETKFPFITGIRLTGRLSGWCSPKDIILKITGMLTVKGGTGHILEYFGEGAESISCTGKATICNMGAETGATCSLFGFDDSMTEYLGSTGRKEIGEMARKVQKDLTGDPEVYAEPEKYFDRFIEINLSEIEPFINGPFTPDLSTPISEMKEKVLQNGWPDEVKTCLIGSCTNSSYEDLSRAASVIRFALENDIPIKSELKVSPGSERVRILAETSGFPEIFRRAGGEIFANACGPCIGQWRRKGAEELKANTIVHSFNRNFAKRADGNPATHAFVASPEIAAAIAIAGRLSFNPLTDTLRNSSGVELKLQEPVSARLPDKNPDPVKYGFSEVTEGDPDTEIVINPSSERLQIPEPFEAWDGKDLTGLLLLIKSKGKCTTDHISMAGEWLRYRGHLANISGNYMTGAINYFNNKTNLVLNRIRKNYESVPETAKTYKNAGRGSIVVGEENFGEGSSREHAALEPRFLGVRAILVKSFARIHEANLKKQGILALTFSDRNDYNRIREDDDIDITGLKEFAPEKKITLVLNHSDGSREEISACHSYNLTQIGWFRAGSALNLIKENLNR